MTGPPAIINTPPRMTGTLGDVLNATRFMTCPMTKKVANQHAIGVRMLVLLLGRRASPPASSVVATSRRLRTATFSTVMIP
jgi:hypothetical protein